MQPLLLVSVSPLILFSSDFPLKKMLLTHPWQGGLPLSGQGHLRGGDSCPRREAVLGMVRKAKYQELLLSELLGRRAPAVVRLGLTYHVHDLIGAQLMDCISTTSGTLLRLPET
ncbi:winged helix repair factor 1-like isoform X1 [Macaca mulatta]